MFRHGAVVYNGIPDFCHYCGKEFLIKDNMTGPKCGCLVGKYAKSKKVDDRHTNQPIGDAPHQDNV